MDIVFWHFIRLHVKEISPHMSMYIYVLSENKWIYFRSNNIASCKSQNVYYPTCTCGKGVSIIAAIQNWDQQ